MPEFDEDDIRNWIPFSQDDALVGIPLRVPPPPQETKSETKTKQADKHPSEAPIALKLMRAILTSVAVLFHDQYEDSYIATMGDGTKVLRLRSKAFRKWFHHLSYQILGKPVNTNTAIDVINTLDGLARHEGERYHLSVRVAEALNGVWYDLGADAVKIEAGEWYIVYRPPILFQRFSHQKPQTEPARGGSLDLLDALLPSSMTSEQRLLFTVSLITGLIPEIPQTVDVIFGDHGSAKSTLTKLKKSLLDPSVIDELTPPTSLGEFMQLLSHHWYVPLGNLTTMPVWMSDAISRASTGSAFAKRELYTDNDDVIYQFYRIMGLNGINLVADKADLLDRALLFGDLERIPEEERKEDTALWRLVRERKPLILGAMFDALARAMELVPSVHLQKTPRMADFTIWGCAVAEAIGATEHAFLNAYYTNIAQQHEEVIAASPVGTVIVAFMQDRTHWEGTPSELLEALRPLAETLQVERHRQFPKNANWVWRRLKEVRVNLREKGIHCEISRDDDRRIHMYQMSNAADGVDGAVGW